jgi:hypothetical protein
VHRVHMSMNDGRERASPRDRSAGRSATTLRGRGEGKNRIFASGSCLAHALALKRLGPNFFWF